MRNFELKNIDSEDLGDFLTEVENSFDIKFVENELINTSTFGELCDVITNKISLPDSESCTSQQAFYKVRRSLAKTLNFDQRNISRETLLLNLFPRKHRRKNVKKVEHDLGFSVRILEPPSWQLIIFLILTIASIVFLFFNWKIGLAGFAFSLIGFRVIFRFAKTLNTNTVGDLAKKMTRENYLKSRNESNSVNKKEIEKVLAEWFREYFLLQRTEIT